MHYKHKQEAKLLLG